MAPDIDGVEYILNFFSKKKNGYLIDVGAMDGANGSMSKDLISEGWNGLLIEPLPDSFKKLKKNYEKYPGAQTIQTLCSNENGEGILYPFRGVSTMSPEWRDVCQNHWKHVNYGKPIKLPKVTLKTLMRLYKVPSHIDFLQIDTEGHDLFVLKGMDWDRKPSLVCVEVIDLCHMERRLRKGIWKPSMELQQYMSDVGYYRDKLTKGGNAIFIRKDND
ncbi:MAG: FkbM family methyltransferase [Candidatus Heimdallarchaeaceae archaeon]